MCDLNGEGKNDIVFSDAEIPGGKIWWDAGSPKHYQRHVHVENNFSQGQLSSLFISSCPAGCPSHRPAIRHPAAMRCSATLASVIKELIDPVMT